MCVNRRFHVRVRLRLHDAIYRLRSIQSRSLVSDRFEAKTMT